MGRASSTCIRLALVVTFAGCHDCPDKPDDCVEGSVTITQGIYGQVLEGDDVVHDENCPQYAVPAAGYPIWLQTDDTTHVVDDVTDEDGAFELVAPAGGYTLCIQASYSSRDKCAGVITMPSTERVRYDVLSNVFSAHASRRGAALCGREP